MTCPETPTLHNTLVSWSATVSMYGTYQAEAEIANPIGYFTVDDFYLKPFAIGLDAVGTDNIDIDAACITGKVYWVYGLIVEVNENREIVEERLRLNVGSFAFRLANKPINTGFYENDTADDVLGDMATVFGGMPAALCNFTSTVKTIYGVVSGSNILAEMQKVAQAAQQDLYVNRSGVLVTTDWKDATSVVDFIIPKEAVISAERVRGFDIGNSRMKIRGRWATYMHYGRVQLQPSGAATDRSGERGKLYHCNSRALPREALEVKINGIPGKDGRTSDVQCETAGYDIIKSIGMNQAEGVTLALTDAVVGFLQPTSGASVLQLLTSAQGFYDKFGDKQAPKATLKATKPTAPRNPVNAIAAFLNRLGPYGYKHPHDPFGSMNSLAIVKEPDEAEELQYELTVTDNDLFAEWGSTTGEIDNPYIADKETMFNVAIREFQRFKMARKAWKFKTIYLSCLDVGDKISIDTPDGETITGLLVEIRVGYSAQPTVEMELTVHSMEDIGNTVYTSSNLLLDPSPISDESVFWSFTGDIRVRLNQPVNFKTNGGMEASFTLEDGGTYTLTGTTTGELTLTVTNGSGSAVVTGSFSKEIVPTATNVTIKLEALGAGVVLTNLMLIKTKTA